MSTVESELERFEASASVRLAATFDLRTCGTTESAGAVADKYEAAGIDFVPVTQAGSIVAVLSRVMAKERREATVAQVMQPLVSEIFVAGSEPLLPVIESLQRGPEFRLVIESSQVLGILTLSDLQKLPVRSLLFGRIAHLELLLMALIRKRAGGDANQWLPKLNESRSAKTKAKFEELKKGNSELDMLEATDFCDKRDLVVELGGLPGWSKNKLEKALNRIEDLRNQVAHASGYADTREQALRVVAQTQTLRNLIAILRNELAATDGPPDPTPSTTLED